MAPLPQNNTGRVWIDYISGSGVTAQEHSIMARFNPATGGSFAGALSFLGLFITVNGAPFYFAGWQALGARYSNPGENFSQPAPLPASLVGFVGSDAGVVALTSEARETRFVGRSTTSGRRVTMSLYGIRNSFFSGLDFRVERVPEGEVDNMLDVLEEATPGNIVAIDGAQPTWYDYANWQNNSYWETELRS